MSQSETDPKKVRIIRDKAFAKRLETAVYAHPQAPDGHGKQKWLRDRIEGRFGAKVSSEAVRKWFAGEVRPRPKTMSYIAQILGVDEGWLSLALQPDSTPEQKRQHNATATAAANLVAGMIQMNGWHIAFPEDADSTIDIYAIIGGRQHSLIVRTLKEHNGSFGVIVPAGHEKSVVMVVVQLAPTEYTILRLSAEAITAAGINRGGYLEVSISHNGSSYQLGDEVLPTILSFDNLDGERPSRRKA